MSYTTISADISSNTVWPAGTYYLTAIVHLGTFNLTLDASAGPIYIKTDGSKYIWANGSGSLTTLNTSLTNKVIFTSKNDDSKGEIISGSTGTPVKGDQTTPYFRTTDNNDTDCSYMECWYAESDTGVLRIGTTVNKNTLNVTYNHLILKYCGIPAGITSAASLVGISQTFNNIGNINIQNLSIDSTNSLKNSTYAYAVSVVSVQTFVFNYNYVNPSENGNTGVYCVSIKTDSEPSIRNNYINGDFSNASFGLIHFNATTITVNLYQNIFKNAGNDCCLLQKVLGTFSANIYNNIFIGASDAGKYGCKTVGLASINESNNGWHNNDTRALGFTPTSPIDADPQLGNLPSGTSRALGYFLPDGLAVRNLSAYEKQGSDTFDNLGIDASLYTATGYEYLGTDKVTPGVNYEMTTFTPLPAPEIIPSSFSVSGYNITYTGQLVFNPNNRTPLWLQNPYF